MSPTQGSLFTGIGGFDLGFDLAGFTTVWQAEYDPTPTSEANPAARPLEQQWNHRVLQARWGGIPNLGDVTRIDRPAHADVVTFGSPCQDLSVAGRRAGLEGARSGLFFQAARLIQQCRPTFAIWENVPGALSSNSGRDFAEVLRAMVDSGATDVAWRIVNARFAGVPQQRRRLFLVADFGGQRAGEILFDTQGCSGHPPAGPETWESVAGSLTGISGRAGRPGGSHDTDLVEEVAKSLGSNATGDFRFDLDHDTYVLQERAVSENLANGPRGKGWRDDGVSYTLESRHHTQIVADPVTSKWAKGSGGPAGDEVQNLVPRWLIQDARNMANKGQNGVGIRDADAAYTLDVMNTQAVAFEPRHFTRGKSGPPSDVVPSLTADSDRGDGQAMVSYTTRSGRIKADGADNQIVDPMIRRFTPTETERLQGFPDGWTCLCGSCGDMFACTCPDGPRYRATGNAVAVPVAYWLATRLRPYFD